MAAEETIFNIFSYDAGFKPITFTTMSSWTTFLTLSDTFKITYVTDELTWFSFEGVASNRS